MTRSSQGHVALVALALIATVVALNLAAAVLAPLVLAFVCAVVLSPVSAFWKRLGIPNAIGALLSFACALSFLGALSLFIEPVALQAYEQIPLIKSELREGLAHLSHLLRGIKDVTQEVQNAIDPAGADAAANAQATIQFPSLGDALFAAPALAGQVLIFVGALFFILLSRDDVYAWLSTLAPSSHKSRTIQCLRDADRRVSRYFLTIALINTGFGALVAGAMATLGLPNAMLWGMVAGLMNFILYLGPAIVAVSLVAAGMITFDGAASLAPAAIFVGLNFMEGQFVTPSLVGRQMQVNPLLVFLSLCLWLWLWGPIGGFVAIPLLVWGMAVTEGLRADQTIASGTPGTEVPNLSAGATR